MIGHFTKHSDEPTTAIIAQQKTTDRQKGSRLAAWQHI
jgi:hypothetical protein